MLCVGARARPRTASPAPAPALPSSCCRSTLIFSIGGVARRYDGHDQRRMRRRQPVAGRYRTAMPDGKVFVPKANAADPGCPHRDRETADTTEGGGLRRACDHQSQPQRPCPEHRWRTRDPARTGTSAVGADRSQRAMSWLGSRPAMPIADRTTISERTGETGAAHRGRRSKTAAIAAARRSAAPRRRA